MNLAIDIGNSLSKAAVIEAGQVVDIFKAETFTPEYLERIFRRYPAIERGILISTREAETSVTEWLQGRLRQFINFDHTIPVPIKNAYATPQTLGCDRLAAAVGAAAISPGRAALVVDFGTAITIDLVGSDGEFQGGSISPGAAMRFRALNEFTRKLPLLELSEQTDFPAVTSESAVRSGVVNGIVYEIEGYIERLAKKMPDFRIIFTGGDGNFFAKRLNYTIFASQDLVLYGLNRILEYNRA